MLWFGDIYEWYLEFIYVNKNMYVEKESDLKEI